jgi:hypothetical protein
MWNVRSRSSPAPIGEATASQIVARPANALAARPAEMGFDVSNRRRIHPHW